LTYYQVNAEKLREELQRRSEVRGESLAGNVEKSWEGGSNRELPGLVQRFGHR
jgi:hypothetical protein